jgi:hypothetical protein
MVLYSHSIAQRLNQPSECVGADDRGGSSGQLREGKFEKRIRTRRKTTFSSAPENAVSILISLK